MSSSPLSDCLRRDGVLPPEVLDAALARQAVYGGALDTSLLELQALDEPTLWSALAVATGVPVPGVALFENPDPSAAERFDATWSRRCRAVPVGEREGNLQLLCSEPIDDAGLGEACTALGVSVEIYVVPEVRLAAARQAVYGEPVPPRLLRLLAKLLGAQAVRRWVEAQRPAGAAGAETNTSTETSPSSSPSPSSSSLESPTNGEVAAVTEFEISVPSFGGSVATPIGRAVSVVEPAPTLPLKSAPSQLSEEQMCRAALDASPTIRGPAMVALRVRLGHPRVKALTEKLRRDLAGPSEPAVFAAGVLGELHEPEAVPALMAALQAQGPLVEAARKALVEITRQDFGTSRRRWGAWWDRHRNDGRMDWLFDGLGHKAAEIRFAASEELRAITGEYFGYHFDLPRRERDEARDRWRTWWYDPGRGR